jgi:hypothetical protein
MYYFRIVHPERDSLFLTNMQQTKKTSKRKSILPGTGTSDSSWFVTVTIHDPRAVVGRFSQSLSHARAAGRHAYAFTKSSKTEPAGQIF